MGADYFSVRWAGHVLPRYSETYTFYVAKDDGARLWVNGQLIIDSTGCCGEPKGTIALTAGAYADIRLDYTEATSAA